MNTTSSLSRRHFLQSTAAAAGTLWIARSGFAHITGANDSIRIGVIGTGGQGTYHVDNFMKVADKENIKVTRVCDVYRRRLNNAAKMISPHTKGDPKAATLDYREVLDDKNIDAVLIATPDHWHTKIAIEAMDAGKDVYVEKPLSLTTDQAIECRDAVKRTKRVLTVGPQGTSEDRWWKAQEAIKKGRIGKPVWSQGSYCRNSRGGQFNWNIDKDAGPNADKSAAGYVDWDQWLGHKFGLAKNIPWNADHFFRFRKYFAYNGGVATDLMYHRLAPIMLAISGPNGEYPKRVTSCGGTFLEKDERDIPDTHLMMIEYPSEHIVVLASVMTNDVGLPDIIRGQHGTMESAKGGWKITEQGEWSSEFRKNNADLVQATTKKNEKGEEKPDPNPGAASFALGSGERRDHVCNWIDAIRGKAQPNCNIDLGCSTMVAIKMGVEAYRQNKVMLWDAKTEKMRAS